MEFVTWKNVMQRKQIIQKKNTKTDGWGSISNTNDVQHEDVCVKFFYICVCCWMCGIVLLCFFLPIVVFVMQLLSNSAICKLICTLNCSVGCSLDHSLGCILEYSLGCSLGCNLDCNQDRFLNYNVDCNEICNMKKVMQRKKIIQKKKKTKTNGWGSVSNTNDVQHEDVCVKFFYIFLCCWMCGIVLLCSFCQSHFFGYAIVNA